MTIDDDDDDEMELELGNDAVAMKIHDHECKRQYRKDPVNN